MNNRILILLICLLSFSTVVGCGQVATSQPTATPIPGWEKFEGGGVELWLPESYEGGDISKNTEVVVENIRNLGPDYEQWAQVIEQNPSMFIIYAFDSEVGDSGFLTNVTVTKEKVLSAMTMDTYLETTKQLPPQFQVVEQAIISLGDYQAGRVVIETTIPTGVFKQLGYSIKDGNTMWGITFTTWAEEFDQHLQVFEQSALTFRIQP